MKVNCANCIYGKIKSQYEEHLSKSIVFLEGEILRKVYSIEKGYIKISKFLENGDEFIIGVLGPGDYVALLAVLQGNENYIASASCLTKVQLRVIDKDDILLAYKSSDEFKDKCLNCAITRSNLFHDQLLISANSETQDKILAILKNLFQKFGVIKDNRYVIKLPFSKTVLANLINIRRETFSRHLTKLQNQGVLTVNNNTYILNYVI
ncbi:MAG: Crp/Fnr family transcriptional regulator [Candidatus Izimaplasma sp.]|nr:Crp/Fnr family transcriptional regulator [Candidatus Izimaplasma bacterium]